MNFENIYQHARQAGLMAGFTKDVNPMYVTDGTQTFKIDDGLCGFASVHFMGNTAFGKWASANGIAKKHYKRGLYIWVDDFNQSYERKSAYAREFVKVLETYGIKAWYESRLD